MAYDDVAAVALAALAAAQEDQQSFVTQDTGASPATVDTHNMDKFAETKHAGGAGPWLAARRR